MRVLCSSSSIFLGAVAAVSVTLANGSANSIQPFAEATPGVIDADPAHPVLVGLIGTRLTQPAPRVELDLVVYPRNATEANAAATAALARFVAAELPGLPAIVHANTPVLGPLGTFERSMGGSHDGTAFAGYVRVALPTPIDDAAVREMVTNLTAEIASGAHGVPADAAIAEVQHNACESIAAPTISQAINAQNRASLRARLDVFAAALGAPNYAEPEITEITPHRFFLTDLVGQPAFHIECGTGEQTLRDTSSGFLVHGSFDVEQQYRFVAPIHFAVAPKRGRVPSYWGQWTTKVRVRADGPVLTLEGSATTPQPPNGMLYVYDPQHVTWSVPDFRDLRQRLRAIGVVDDDVIAQLRPHAQRPFVLVHSAAPGGDQRIIAAIAGSAPAEMSAVRVAPTYDTCRGEPEGLALAVADATARAQQIAARLGTTVQSGPFAVAIQRSPIAFPCSDQTPVRDADGQPFRQRVAGALVDAPELGDGSEVTVSASYRIGNPRALVGSVKEAATNGSECGAIARCGYLAPPMEYPAAAITGEAQLELATAATGLRFHTRLDQSALEPDAAFGGRSLIAEIARDLKVSDAAYSAQIVSGPIGRRVQVPEQVDFDAEMPHADAATRAAIFAATAHLRVWDVTAESNDCARASDELARDTIRAATEHAGGANGARLIAIDLRGPFAIDGSCERGLGGSSVTDGGARNVPGVRLAAYARVSFGQ